MRFETGFLLVAVFVASSAGAQVPLFPGACPGGANMELTALTLPQVHAPPRIPDAPKRLPVRAPVTRPEPEPPPQPKSRPVTPPKRIPPRRAVAPVLAPPAPPPFLRPRQRPVATDAALDDMIGTFGGRPTSRPVVDTDQQFPTTGLGSRLRDQSGFIDREPVRRPTRPSPTETTRPQSTPQTVPSQTGPTQPRPTGDSIFQRGTRPALIPKRFDRLQPEPQLR